jgi:[acyl-carrier-protein] S-malonyltransferase
VLVIVAPGQGAQTPGFLRPWLELDGVAERLRWWSAVSGIDLVHYGTEADAETIRDTAIAQPLLVAAGLIGVTSLFPDAPDGLAGVGAAAGHSVGELTAAAATGAITAESAMVLVRERGKAMARAAEATPTSMTAILGGDRETVLARLAELDLVPANDNGAGQIVAAGDLKALARLADEPPARARLRPLSVAGAFHTHYMESAVDTLAALVPAVPVRDPRTRYVSNADGSVVDAGAEILRRIVAQVASPVRWDLCMATMAELGVTALIEMPPAGTLTGLTRRALPGVKTLALKTPADLDAARAMLAEHGGAHQPTEAPATEQV